MLLWVSFVICVSFHKHEQWMPFALFYSDRVRSHMLTRRHVLTAAIFHIFSKLCRKNNARRHVLTDEHWKDMCIEEHCMEKT